MQSVNVNAVFICTEQATTDDVLHAQASVDWFVVVISRIVILLAGTAATVGSNL